MVGSKMGFTVGRLVCVAGVDLEHIYFHLSFLGFSFFEVVGNLSFTIINGLFRWFLISKGHPHHKTVG